MKIARMIKFSTLALLLTGLFTYSAHALEDADIPTEGITQGEFAMWLVKAAGAEGNLPPAALQDDAIKFLTKLGIQPKEGWDADKKLTKKDLQQMLGVSDKDAEGKSWAELIKQLVDFLINALNQLAAINSNNVSPSVSPGGGR